MRLNYLNLKSECQLQALSFQKFKKLKTGSWNKFERLEDLLERAKLRAMHDFMPYVPMTFSPFSFFYILCVIFHVSYVPLSGVFIFVGCFKVFACITCLHFFTFLPVSRDFIFTCITCLHYLSVLHSIIFLLVLSAVTFLSEDILIKCFCFFITLYIFLRAFVFVKYFLSQPVFLLKSHHCELTLELLWLLPSRQSKLLNVINEDVPSPLLHKRYAIACKDENGKTVEHVPEYVSKQIHFFIKYSGRVEMNVNGQRRC